MRSSTLRQRIELDDFTANPGCFTVSPKKKGGSEAALESFKLFSQAD